MRLSPWFPVSMETDSYLKSLLPLSRITRTWRYEGGAPICTARALESSMYASGFDTRIFCKLCSHLDICGSLEFWKECLVLYWENLEKTHANSWKTSDERAMLKVVAWLSLICETHFAERLKVQNVLMQLCNQNEAQHNSASYMTTRLLYWNGSVMFWVAPFQLDTFVLSLQVRLACFTYYGFPVNVTPLSPHFQPSPIFNQRQPADGSKLRQQCACIWLKEH